MKKKKKNNQPTNTLAGSNFFWSASHAVGGAAFASSRSHTPSFLKSTGDSEPISTQQQQTIRQPQQQPQAPAAPQTNVSSFPPEIQKDAATVDSGNSRGPPCDECGASIV